MDFGQALQAMKGGNRVTRSVWNDKDMWIALRNPEWDPVMGTLPYIYMNTVQDDLVPWLSSQTDLLADDWDILPE